MSELVKLKLEIMSNLKRVSTPDVRRAAQLLLKTRDKLGRVWVAGNGGSAAIASHFTSDLMNLGFDVKCLVDNVARLTALTNDEGWERAYDMQMPGFSPVDSLVLFTVHGASGGVWSSNLANAAALASMKGGSVILVAGCDGGKIKRYATAGVTWPSGDPYVVEGLFSVVAHMICAELRDQLEGR
ncbi:MAG: SIS domain-containing protein [Deltaproteobacteria bacterium]|nr:SIS domain-containing protein [Deltaproteobacteria bacterium]